jgi:hypothetical protein
MHFRSTSFLLPLLLSSASAPGGELATRIEFPKTAYTILTGQEFQTTVGINPLPASGLFSYGLIITVEGNNGLIGITTMTPQPALTFDGVMGPGSRGVAAEAGRFSAKGSVNIFLPEKANHLESSLGTLTVAGLPEGTYTLRLATYNTLGPTESIFVDGQCRSLDPGLQFGTAALTVSGRPQGTITPFGAMTADRQTGLLTQQYDVKNTSSTAAAFRILIRNMPAGSQVWNAQGTVDGIPYIDLPQALAAGGTQRITIEYRSADRTTIPNPGFEIVSAGAPPATPAGLTLNLQPRATLSGGNVLLEFNSEAGKSYYIQYGTDPASWKTALPKVEGTGNRVQWIDNGPPKTDSLPSTSPTRFYRIVVSEPAP